MDSESGKLNGPENRDESVEKVEGLAEVWGETVSLRNLAIALSISVPTTVVVFFVGRIILDRIVSDPDQAETFTLLCGLAAVVTCAVICARLFKPQRILVTDGAEDTESVEEAIRDMAENEGGIGRVSDLPESVQQEIKELGLYDAFLKAESRSEGGRHA